jgi:hypothetical protein
MFASICTAGTEQFYTWNYSVFMVIGERFSITLDSVRDNYWSHDQQVNCLLLSWYCNNL